MYLIAMKNWTASDSSQREEKNIKLNMLNTMKKKKICIEKDRHFRWKLFYGTIGRECKKAFLIFFFAEKYQKHEPAPQRQQKGWLNFFLNFFLSFILCKKLQACLHAPWLLTSRLILFRWYTTITLYVRRTYIALSANSTDVMIFLFFFHILLYLHTKEVFRVFRIFALS